MTKLEEEKKYISELGRLLEALYFGMNHDLISNEGIKEIYEMLTDYRRCIHNTQQDILMCCSMPSPFMETKG